MSDLRELIQARLAVADTARTEAAARLQREQDAIIARVRTEAGRNMLVHLRVRMKWAQSKAEVQMLKTAAEQYANEYPELADEFRALLPAAST